MSGSPTRVIVWATGSVGQDVIRRCAIDPNLELVGAFVYGADKDGEDAGTIAGVAPLGVTATRDRRTIVATDADVVIHAPKGHHLDEQHDGDVEALLRSGKNVISTRGYFNPWAFGERYAQRWLDACNAGGVTLAGLGMSPGFVGERVAITLSGGCLELKTLTLREAYDCTKLLPTMLEKMGFGSSPVDYAASSINVNYDDLYLPTLHNVVAGLGGTVERWEASHEVVTAEADVTEATWPVPAGSVQGTLRRWTGYSGGARSSSRSTCGSSAKSPIGLTKAVGPSRPTVPRATS